MNSFIEKALDLERLSLLDESVRLGFERPLPAWAWVMIVVAALGISILSYRRMLGPLPARTILGAIRGLAIIALAVLISGPQLVKGDETVERDWVLVLVDRSASLTLADVELPGSTARISRNAALQRALTDAWPAWSAVAQDREVLWLGFDRGAFDLSRPDAAPPDLGVAEGRATAIGAALDQALARAAARPMSAVVILSDGRSIDTPSRAALRRLQADRIPVHTVALGSRDPIGDIAIARIDGPRSAFVGDVAPIRVELARAGSGAGGATVRLIDSATRIVLDERRIEPDALAETGRAEAVLVHRPTTPGRETWTVEITPDGADLVDGNNTGELAIELVDRPMRVLYVDGYPRWEQRYLRNLLLREKSIVSSGIMLAPDRSYTQEGDILLDEIPDSPERWAEFDAVILGDVRPDMFTREQLAQLRDHIAERGAGLLWIGGEAETPVAWWDTPLAELLPFSRSATDAMVPLEPFVLEPGPAADALGVLRLAVGAEQWWPADLSDHASGWATFFWGQRIDTERVKPTAQTIASAREAFSGAAYPIVLTMRYGAGRIAYIGTDEVWRYRFGQGENLYERFWVPLVRMLGRESLARSGSGALLTVSSRQVVVEQPVRITVELVDQSLMDQDLRTIDARIERTSTDPTDPATSGSTVVSLRKSAASPRLYEGSWTPADPGLWAITALDQELDAPLTERVEVILPRDELRFPEADHEALERLSAETQGRHVAAADLASLTEHLPNRKLRILTETTESLWDTPLALAVLLLLLTAEWVGRRVIRLV
jgi:hypothetical protein